MTQHWLRSLVLFVILIGIWAGPGNRVWAEDTPAAATAQEECPQGETGCPGMRGPGECGGDGPCGQGMGGGMHRRGPGPHHGPPPGMGHGMMGGGMMGGGGAAAGTAACPQDRNTAQAPEPQFSASNPLTATPESIERGRLLFQEQSQPLCAACHGENGDGRGMIGGGLQPPPRNFTCKDTMRAIPDGQLFWIIQNGSPGTGMPPFPGLGDRDIWHLVLYLRSLAK